MPEFHVSSLVVQHVPGQAQAIEAAASALPGVEWVATEAGKAVVTLVTDSQEEVLDRIADIDRIPGVHTTTLVYHRYEEAGAETAVPVFR